MTDHSPKLREIASKATKVHDEVSDLKRKLSRLSAQLSALQNDLLTLYQLEHQGRPVITRDADKDS